MKIKIRGYELDPWQEEVVYASDKYTLLLAGAGTGKTFTILGKIKYLITSLNYQEEDILCISFTNMATKQLKEMLAQEGYQKICVLTFHKLALLFLKDFNYSFVDSSNLLAFIIDEFFNYHVSNYPLLQKMILRHFHIFSLSKVKSYQMFLKSKHYLKMQKLIIKIILLNKSNAKGFRDYYNNIAKYASSNYLVAYLTLIIYYIYQVECESANMIDFDDILYQAIDKIKTSKLKLWRFVLVDEYQDTSYLRFLFLKELLVKSKAKLLAVGDDYQSIYRFTGCDLSLFLNFSSWFAEASIKKIEKTYRNSQELINIASSFIMKNKKQLKKELVSDKHLQKPIKIVFTFNKKRAFEKLVNIIPGTLLVLGRNNFDIYSFLNSNFRLENNKIDYCRATDKLIYYLTVHKAKGLEEDNVLVINNEDALYGFPNQVVDAKILKDFYPQDNFLYEEERRLFYVALTRTRNNVYLLTTFNPSCFIKELLKDYPLEIEKIFI